MLTEHESKSSTDLKEHYQGCDSALQAARRRLIGSVPPALRSQVESVLSQPRNGGRGLRMWLTQIARTSAPLIPDSLPDEMVNVYLEDPEALPLHDCEQCGIAIPIRLGISSDQALPERTYFATCPVCGGRTGLHAYWSTCHGAEERSLTTNSIDRLKRISR